MSEVKEKTRIDVWECALGFMDAQVLLTAEELGVFDVLEEAPRTAAGVAEVTGLPEDPADRLLTALCALGLVERSADGRYANGPEASRQLVRGRPEYVGGLFRHVRETLYDSWGQLKRALTEGEGWHSRPSGDGAATPTGHLYDDPEALRSFMDGMHGITYRAAREFASYAGELEDVRHVVDVGGSSGAFLIALAQRFPALTGTVFDLPPVGPIAEDYVREAGLDDRISFRGGDFWEDPLPRSADAYALGFILHDWDDEGGSFLLAKIAEAAPPGGRLILGEYLLDDDRTGPLFVARQSLNMLVSARGRERTAKEYAEWAGRFGFELERIFLTHTGKNFLMMRKGTGKERGRR